MVLQLDDRSSAHGVSHARLDLVNEQFYLGVALVVAVDLVVVEQLEVFGALGVGEAIQYAQRLVKTLQLQAVFELVQRQLVQVVINWGLLESVLEILARLVERPDFVFCVLFYLLKRSML